MKKVTLQINSADERREVTLEDELSIGRTDVAKLVLGDPGLSRLNTTFFRDGDDVFIVDENSTNGTFVNGQQVFSAPHQLNDRDEITTGNNTQIHIEIREAKEAIAPQPIKKGASKAKAEIKHKTPVKKKPPAPEQKLPLIPIIAGIAVLAIILFATIAILIVNSMVDNSNSKVTPTAQLRAGVLIPVRVIDPLGGEDPEDLDDLIAILEQDIPDEVQDSTAFDEVKTTGGKTTSETGLNLDVPVSFWESQKALAMGARDTPTGTDPPGQLIPPEIAGGGGVPKQKAKLAEMKGGGYRQPMDFADLAAKRLNGELIELPMATQTFFLDVGGNASEGEFVGFDFNRFKGNFNDCVFEIAQGSPQFQALSTLAKEFEYDLNNPRHRKQMRIRLLRMFNKRALPILQELAGAYYNEFKKPLRVTSLTRSMDYQISLNKNNANSFKVKGPDSLPPHTSGCAFDLSRKQMTAKEQSFVMAKLAEMEKRGVLDGLREGGVNACFHTFIYFDGIKPKGF